MIVVRAAVGPKNPNTVSVIIIDWPSGRAICAI